eukprot:992304-Pelagomonas_calceolata.AAC.1
MKLLKLERAVCSESLCVLLCTTPWRSVHFSVEDIAEGCVLFCAYNIEGGALFCASHRGGMCASNHAKQSESTDATKEHKSCKAMIKYSHAKQ